MFSVAFIWQEQQLTPDRPNRPSNKEQVTAIWNGNQHVRIMDDWLTDWRVGWSAKSDDDKSPFPVPRTYKKRLILQKSPSFRASPARCWPGMPARCCGARGSAQSWEWTGLHSRPRTPNEREKGEEKRMSSQSAGAAYAENEIIAGSSRIFRGSPERATAVKWFVVDFPHKVKAVGYSLWHLLSLLASHWATK